MPRRAAILSLASVAISLLAPLEVSAQREDSFPLRLGAPRMVGREAALGGTIDSDVGPGGTVFVVDHLNAQVVAFSPDGRLLWRAGRKGRGPGEFQMPYRVAARDDGGILVYDINGREVSHFSAGGRFQRRWSVPISFHQVDKLVALRGGAILVAGIAPVDAPGGRSAVHRFTPAGAALKHAGSFAPLPVFRDTTVRRYWSAGHLARTASGEFLFLRRVPYEINRFDEAGRSKAVIRPPFRTRGTPEDAVRIEREGRGIRISDGDPDVMIPSSVHELRGGWLLVGRATRTARFWDLFAPDGQYVGTRRLPEGWMGIAAYDAARGVLWIDGEEEGEPVLFRVPVTVGSR